MAALLVISAFVVAFSLLGVAIWLGKHWPTK